MPSEIRDPRIEVLESAALAESRRLDLARRVRSAGLCVVEQADLSEDEFEALALSLGTPITHPFLGNRDREAVARIGREADVPGTYIYGGAWHQNLAFLAGMPDVTILYGAKIESAGNYTAFADLVEVGKWVSAGAWDFLRTVSAVHSTTAKDSPQNAYGGSLLGGQFQSLEPQEAIHPCVVSDEVTELCWPFVYSNYIVRFDGWHARESMPLVESFRDFARHDEFVIRHYWSEGDLVLWDNRRMVHRATVTHPNGTRLMLRSDLDVGWGV